MISYREVSPHDVPGLEHMRLPDTVAGPADPRMAVYLRREHHPQQALLPRVMYLAETPKGPIGYIGGHLTERYGCDGEVQYLYVSPDHRRLGVATELLRMVMSWFEEKSASNICVDVAPDNEGARAFYHGHGAVFLNSHWLVWKSLPLL